MTNFENNRWLNYMISINHILSNENIKNSVSQFWTDIALKLNENQYLLIQFKIQEITGEIKSIYYVQRVNKKDLNSLTNIFIEFWNIKSEDYHLIEVSKLIFNYKTKIFDLQILNGCISAK